MLIGKGSVDRNLTLKEIREIVRKALLTVPLDDKRVLILIPDGTRTMPMSMMFDLFKEFLEPRVKKFDYLVALGTHHPMNDAQFSGLIGREVVSGRCGSSHIYNHEWHDPLNFASLGTIPASDISQLTGGRLAQEVPVRINKLIFDYDQLIICGPVFPHEVAGFSGGNKYFFPGIAGPEIINFTHWLGALMTNYEVNGVSNTSVRNVINRASKFIDCPKTCFSLVVTPAGLAGIFFGSPEGAWQAAANLSAKTHVIYVDKPFQCVLSSMPQMYDDLWTAAKGMYKTEPVVADGGEVIIYAPHISEISYTHGKLIEKIGYHCRDYYLKQWDKFKDYPGCILAHSTHVKGLGTYDLTTGQESSRIRVTLATSISAKVCKRLNLGYLDPEKLYLEEWKNREDEGILYVPKAGEVLYRIRQIDKYKHLNLREPDDL